MLQEIKEMDFDDEDGSLYPNTDLSVWLRTCKQEILKPIEGIVAFGKVPTWISGSLVRNGPGGMDLYSEQQCKHLFDGPGLLQKFEIQDGRVSYMNRFIDTKSHERNKAGKRLMVSEFGTVAVPDPCQTIFSRISSLFTSSIDQIVNDTANISIHPFGDEIYSLSETPFAHKIYLDSLETACTIDVNKSLGIVSHTSHPHICGNKVYNLGQRLGSNESWWPHYVIYELEQGNATYSPIGHKDGSLYDRAKIVATVQQRWRLHTCYMHSFSVTPHYFIIIEQPLSLFLPQVPLNFLLAKKSMAAALKFYPKKDTLIHIIPRAISVEGIKKGSDGVITFRTDSFFYLHTINAYEEVQGTRVVLDVCTYKDPSMIECMYKEALENAQTDVAYASKFRSRPKRFVMDLKHEEYDEWNDDNERVVAETIVDIGCETPRINYEQHNGRPYRYFYAISSDVDADNPGTLIKVDVEKKRFKTWCEPNGYPSEPIFLARPACKKEDDGLILSSVVYGRESITGPNTVSLIILDAEKWELLAKVEFRSQGPIPKCLHGWFFPQKKGKKPGRLDE